MIAHELEIPSLEVQPTRVEKRHRVKIVMCFSTQMARLPDYETTRTVIIEGIPIQTET